MTARPGRPGLAVVGGLPGPAWPLAEGLASLGLAVAVVPVVADGGAPASRSRAAVPAARPGSAGPRVAPAWDGTDRAALAAALGAAGRPGEDPVSTVVWAHAPAVVTAPAPLAELGEERWAAAAERPLSDFRTFLQGSFAHLAGRRGAIVALVPSSALTGGAAGYVPWAALAEGQRALVRIAARGWGHRGIRVNTVAVTPDLLAGAAVASPGRPRLRPGLRPAALGAPGMRDEVAAVVASLAGPDWRGVTGATVGVDGGVWMAP